MNQKRVLSGMIVAMLTAGVVLAPVAIAQASTAAVSAQPVVAAERQQTFALVSAVGDQFTFVRQKQITGSNILDNNIRSVIRVPGNGLNLSVLRGLDSAITAAHPESKREYITLNHAEMDGVAPQDREAVAIGKIVAALEKYPNRLTWEKIIVATPKYLFSERAGMGPKLNGIGVYVQPLSSAVLEGQDGNPDIDASGQGESDTTNPEDGTKNRSKVYVAPFSYIQLYVLDPKTLRVVEKVARHDFTKLNDPNSTALDVGRSIPVEMLANRMNTLIERSAARALGETEVGVTVTVGEVVPRAVATTPTGKK